MKNITRIGMFVLFIAVIITQIVSAATIEGTIYDFSLEKVNTARVTINTQPKQQLVAKNAAYRFDVPTGAYTLIAQQLDQSKVIAQTEENITIPKEGTFHVDLILFPYFGQEEEILQTTLPLNEGESVWPSRLLGIAVVLVLVALIGSIAYLAKNTQRLRKEVNEKSEENKKEQKTEENKTKNETNAKEKINAEMPDDLQELLHFIKINNGRVTQKDIRKQFPLSEAKISLMVTDLEQRGFVQKVKKGRGNVVILK